MFKRFLPLFIIMFVLSSALFAQNEGKLFVSIKLDNKKTELDRLELPVYHHTEKNLLTELTRERLTELEKAGFDIKVLDMAENAANYFIIDKKRDQLQAADLKENLISIDDFLLLKKSDAADFPDDMMKVEIKKTPLIYKNAKEKFIFKSSQTSIDFIQNVLDEINQDSVEFFIQSLQDFGTRHLYNEKRRDVSLWIMKQFKKFGIESARLDSFQYKGLWQYNVVAEITGSSGSDEVIVIGAHHDSITNANPYDGNTAAPGADDNASGTSAVLEIARAIMKAGYQPEKTLVFQTYAAEELGLHGSKDLAQKAREDGAKIKLMINHDMISSNFSDLDNSYVVVNYYYGSDSFREMAYDRLETFTSLSPVKGSASGSSDSYSFAQAGYPAVYFEEYDFSPWYHTTDDIISNYDMEYCAEVIKASAATVITVSEYPSALDEVYVYDLGTGSSLLLEWEKSLDKDTEQYKISIGKSSGIYDEFFLTADTTFVLNNLDEGEEYFIGLSVIDADGNESPIQERNLTPNSKPLIPKAAFAKADWLKINLSWNPNKEVDLAGYNVYRSEEDTIEFERINDSPISSTIFTDEKVNSGSYYFYYVAAIDKDGNESDGRNILRSRAVSLDKGVVIIDETEDGDGTELKPFDKEVDEFYKKILKDFLSTKLTRTKTAELI